jgi:hypothetical protein
MCISYYISHNHIPIPFPCGRQALRRVGGPVGRRRHLSGTLQRLLGTVRPVVQLLGTHRRGVGASCPGVGADGGLVFRHGFGAIGDGLASQRIGFGGSFS